MNRLLVTVCAAALSITGLMFAAPASAGCEANMLGVQYCDGPIRPDGTWDRCWHSDAFATYGPLGQVQTITPAMGKCFPVDPSQPWPPIPIAQPQYHVYP